ncbi:hypothetical protein [Rhizobium sp. 2MFCol3.1]|uniref:hypothetical protein n=1 Tax=Rhizobium sp. 2MFCol3.1 TaxID=1246459 RepID=UPI0012DFC2F4|nr:hypothetical protein [Rhizobium sp. 2MFCol3.1]
MDGSIVAGQKLRRRSRDAIALRARWQADVREHGLFASVFIDRMPPAAASVGYPIDILWTYGPIAVGQDRFLQSPVNLKGAGVNSRGDCRARLHGGELASAIGIAISGPTRASIG